MDEEEEEQMDQTILGHGSTRTPVIVSVQGEGGWVGGWVSGWVGGWVGRWVDEWRSGEGEMRERRYMY